MKPPFGKGRTASVLITGEVINTHALALFRFAARVGRATNQARALFRFAAGIKIGAIRPFSMGGFTRLKPTRAVARFPLRVGFAPIRNASSFWRRGSLEGLRKMKFKGLTSDQIEELSRYIRTTAWRLYKNDFWKQNDYEDVVQIGWAVACEKRELFMGVPFKKALASIGVTFGYAVEQSTGYYGHGKIKPYAAPFTAMTNKLRKEGVLDERSGFENIVTRESSDEWLARRALLGAFLLEYCGRTFPKRGRVQKEVARAWLENLDINDGPEKYGFSRAAYHDAKKRVVAKLRREIGEGATIRGLRDFLRDKKYEADRKCAELWRKNRGGVRHNERGAWRFMDAANAYEQEFVR